MRNDLEFSLDDVLTKVEITRGAHVRFSTLQVQFLIHLNKYVKFFDDDDVKEYHWLNAVRCYLVYLVGTTIFNNKSATYVDIMFV